MQEEGSHKRWNEIWKNSGKHTHYDLSMLFTKNQPRNIYEFWQKAYYEDLKQMINKNNFKDFLELGSGRGTTSMYLIADGFTNVKMLDISTNSFDLAKVNFKKVDMPEPEMIIADVRNTGLPSESFDCIYNIGLLEHFEDPRPVLAEAFRLLKPNGCIFMPIFPAMPYAHSLKKRFIFNPISAGKYLLKKIINHQSLLAKSQKNGMIRTGYQEDFYNNLANEIGYRNYSCIPYNSYWKVNKNKWFEENITLRAYKIIYALNKKIKKGFYLECQKDAAFSFLLTGYKK